MACGAASSDIEVAMLYFCWMVLGVLEAPASDWCRACIIYWMSAE